VTSGETAVEALSSGPSVADASVASLSTGLMSAGVIVADGLVFAPATAEVDGNVVAGSLRVVASNGGVALSSTRMRSIGIGFSVEAARSRALVDGLAAVRALVAPSVTVVGGDVFVRASSADSALASSDVAGGGLIDGDAATLVSAVVLAETLASFSGLVVNGGDVSVSAASANQASAVAEVFSVGALGADAVASALALVAVGAQTRALLTSVSSVAAAGAVAVEAFSANTTFASAKGLSGSLLSAVGLMRAVAAVGGPTSGVVLGPVSGGGMLGLGSTGNWAVAGSGAEARGHGVVWAAVCGLESVEPVGCG